MRDLEQVLKVCDGWDADPKTKIIFQGVLHEICDLNQACKEMKETSGAGDAKLAEALQLLETKIVTLIDELTMEVKGLKEAHDKDVGSKAAYAKVGAAVFAFVGVVAGALGGAIASHLWN